MKSIEHYYLRQLIEFFFFFFKLNFQANIEKIILLLSTALKGSPDNENVSLHGEAAILLEDLKQLFAALDVRSV